MILLSLKGQQVSASKTRKMQNGKQKQKHVGLHVGLLRAGVGVKLGVLPLVGLPPTSATREFRGRSARRGVLVPVLVRARAPMPVLCWRVCV